MFSSQSNRPAARWLPRIAAAAGLAVIALAAAFLFTPERQALAEALKHFFRPVDAEQMPTPSSGELAAPTYAPTYPAQLASPATPQPEATPPPAPSDPADPITLACEPDPYGYACKLAWAEKRAGFDAKEFPADPKGFVFREVSKADATIIMLEYGVTGGGGYLYLNQGLGDEIPPEYLSGVPEEAIQPVRVGDALGEYVEGQWVVGGIYTQYTWLDGPTARLRWAADGRWFELVKQAAMPPTDYMTRDVMVDMALHLVDRPDPAASPRLDYLTLEEAAQTAGFAVASPSILPEGFGFSFASYDEERARLTLNYAPDGDAELGEASLVIYETPLGQADPETFEGQAVDVNGFPGVYGSADPSAHVLTWQTGELEITLSVNASPYYGARFTRDQILEIARSVK